MLQTTGEANVNMTTDTLSVANAVEPASTTYHAELSNWPGLEAAASSFGIRLDAIALDRFRRYRDLIVERSAQFNLTALRSPEAIEQRLMLDAVLMLPTLDTFVVERQIGRSQPLRLIDVGSGAGFPGLALKIARPSLNLVLLDATAKKVRFLNEAIDHLSLTNATALHGRAEELGRDSAYRERFDLATARAVAPLPVLLELVTPFLDVGGEALLPKGLEITDELRTGISAAKSLGSELLSSKVLASGDTRLVVVRKNTLTPKAFPRRTGLPSQQPLGKGR